MTESGGQTDCRACRNCGAKRPATATWIFVPSQWGLIPICWHCWSLEEQYGGWLGASLARRADVPGPAER
jgi:hypothetical protein